MVSKYPFPLGEIKTASSSILVLTPLLFTACSICVHVICESCDRLQSPSILIKFISPTC